MKRFCVKCGKETNELINGLCVSCFLEKNRVLELPKRVEIDSDKRTGRVRVGLHWVEPDENTVSDVIKERLDKLAKQKKLAISGFKAVFGKEEKRIMPAQISFSVEYEGVPLQVKEDIEVFFRATISDASMKLASNYHEAIIQVRFSEKVDLKEEQAKLQEVLSALAGLKKKDELSEAVNVKKERGGYDLFIGSNKSAKKVSGQLAKKFKADLTYSNKLIGVDEHGKEKHRNTYCIRFKSNE